jgi:hypothetical protein
MIHHVTKEMSMLITGAGIAFGECVCGVNGPFLFNRLWHNDGLCAMLGVLVGAALGYGGAAMALHVYQHKPFRWHATPRIATSH